MTDKVLDMYLSKEIKKSLWTEDYDGCYEYWRFKCQRKTMIQLLEMSVESKKLLLKGMTGM